LAGKVLIDKLKKEYDLCVSEVNLLRLKNESLGDEISKINTKFSLCSKTLKHIRWIQIPHYNKSGMGCKENEDAKNPFPKANNRLKRKSLERCYKYHFNRQFTGATG